MLVNGTWQANWDPVQKKDEQGRFIRQSSSFRDRISPEEIAAIKDKPTALPRHFSLYVAYICPWATRVLIARSLFELENVIDLKVTHPRLSDEGWFFGEYANATAPSDVEFSHMHQLYTQTDANYTGRATVPVLWDNITGKIRNNESSDLLRILNEDFRPLHNSSYNIAPIELLPEIDDFNEKIYNTFNNGVYRAGFASTQEAYEEAYNEVFSTLEWLETHLQGKDYVVGNQLTESDIRLFVTLARFDCAYYGIFKTNKKMIRDYVNVSRYFEQLIEIKAFNENIFIDHIKAGYYSIKALNPTGIIPKGPYLPWYGKLKNKDV